MNLGYFTIHVEIANAAESAALGQTDSGPGSIGSWGLCDCDARRVKSCRALQPHHDDLHMQDIFYCMLHAAKASRNEAARWLNQSGGVDPPWCLPRRVSGLLLCLAQRCFTIFGFHHLGAHDSCQP